MGSEQSFDDVLSGLRVGDQTATTQLFRRFARELCCVAQRNLGEQVRRKVDADDVVQSVFRTFFRRSAAGEFSLRDWNDLWGLLVTIALRKCRRQVEFLGAACRDYGREVPMDDEPFPASRRTPTPEAVAAFAETLEFLMRDLNDRGKQILTMRLEGYSVTEISSQVRRTERTVFRTIEQLKVRLQSWLLEA